MLCAMDGDSSQITLSKIYEHRPLYSVKCLYQKGYTDIRAQPGVYFVLVPDGFEVNFSDCTTAIPEYEGRSLLYPADELASKFAKGDKKILYIGKSSGARYGLRQRIRQLVCYGYRNAKNHRGGRALWQIVNAHDLLVGYLPCEQAAQVETELLRDYCDRYGTLPVANWVPHCNNIV